MQNYSFNYFLCFSLLLLLLFLYQTIILQKKQGYMNIYIWTYFVHNYIHLYMFIYIFLYILI